MMCKQYTITGMNKKKNWLLLLLWFFVAATSRIQYFIFGGRSMLDTYGYFTYAMIRAQKQEPVLNSGLSYAYTRNLSRLLKFTGNLIDAVGIYQLVIQVLWVVLLLAGISMLFGRLAGFVSSGILIVSPWILQSVFSVSPENYFMLHFSALLVLLGYFHDRARKGEWKKKVWQGLYLKLTGFLAGMMCIWNYLGWLLLTVMVYVLICHFKELKSKITLQKQEKELKNKERVMKVRTQIWHLLTGLLIGLSATLIKYTGLTGDTIVDQFYWWIHQFQRFPERCQDVSAAFSLWLGGALLAGVLCQAVYCIVKSKKTESVVKEQAPEVKMQVIQDEAPNDAAEAVEEGSIPEAEAVCYKAPEAEVKEQAAEPEMPAEEIGDYVVTQDGRKVRLLENPLPVPKKHVKKDMDFDLDECRMEFDVEINENDDFDI